MPPRPREEFGSLALVVHRGKQVKLTDESGRVVAIIQPALDSAAAPARIRVCAPKSIRIEREEEEPT